MNRIAAVLAGLAVSLSAFAGAALAQGVDNPITRSFYWFRFVAGKDIRDACGSGPDHYRLVYNAIYREQVRAYDVVAQPNGGAMLTTRVFGQAGIVNNIVINDVVDILGPWRGIKTERALTSAEFAGLTAAMEQSGALRFPAKRFEVPSNDFYWAVTACRGGQFTATAFHHPTDGFQPVRFDKPLFDLDTSGVTVNPPRKLEPSAFRGDPNQVWRLRVTPQGIEY
ncbi:MAG: hypothetical protein AB7R90_07885 [Reyranellaceae bacterium]